MKKNSADWYIKENDFEGCLERFDNARKNWREHWFKTLQTIYNNCKDWAKKYILDPIEKSIIVIADQIKKTVVKKEENKNNNSHTYLINMYDENENLVFTKIGKADNLKRRFKQLLKHQYKNSNAPIARIEPLKIFECPNDDLAQVLESLIRNLFRKSHDFIPNDRFKPFEPTQEEWKEMERFHELVLNQ